MRFECMAVLGRERFRSISLSFRGHCGIAQSAAVLSGSLLAHSGLFGAAERSAADGELRKLPRALARGLVAGDADQAGCGAPGPLWS